MRRWVRPGLSIIMMAGTVWRGFVGEVGVVLRSGSAADGRKMASSDPRWYGKTERGLLAMIAGLMAAKPTKRRSEFDVIEPIGMRVVIRKDENRRETKGGIVLPDSHEIPVITGRVVAVSKAIERSEERR